MAWLNHVLQPLEGAARLLQQLPRSALEVIRGERASWQASRSLRWPYLPLDWNAAGADSLLQQLELLLPHGFDGVGPAGNRHPAHKSPLTCQEDQDIVNQIEADLIRENRSNTTRTAAYLEVYETYPELHWSLLAHFVSRNGGYNMTDLQGGLMDGVLDQEQREALYRLLERCNALIFQDAYPQLQLYRHSRRLGRSCFHLLPYFHVSAFMKPVWERFWTQRESSVLTVALIINEQNYIEGRVVNHPYFRKHVLDTASFKAHDRVQLNQVVFPLEQDGGLAGLVLERFARLAERIEFGKSLYAMLFGHAKVLDRALAFARRVPHEGSRAEYWPRLFTPEREQALYSPEESAALAQTEWLQAGRRLYSPVLKAVWNDTPYEPIPRYDWFQDGKALSHLHRPRRPYLFEISHKHRFGLMKTAWLHDAAALADGLTREKPSSNH
ncbi:DUF2515 family protein [Paenibacillus sp. JX-17]|uniref:DUF2515 family protein n=1 Tax=Paenibacillus lacisoli TaxID=3064525 RepID=A0ABT9CEL7_9BACL|nr:DUF2515 family protein [Paenibacillus sp. JX-17]MDO7907074.1 DUF2515 family protein [Paenibacillus sp. JX-17]